MSEFERLKALPPEWWEFGLDSEEESEEVEKSFLVRADAPWAF